MNSKEFLNLLKLECESFGVTYLFPETENVTYPGTSGIQVSGYFDDKIEPTLACAIGKPEADWYEILVHESCHMDQWHEQSETWNNCFANGIDCDKGMDEWLSGKEFHIDEYTHYIRTMQAVEIDCEKRTARKILDLNLNIDLTQYIKKANTYLFYYSVLLETKKWCDVAPYKIPEIVEQMPHCYLKPEEYFNVSPELLELYTKKCYNS
jgi:predicted aminopeptidase